MISWKGKLISSMDFKESAAQYPGSVYWDFHRANLHRGLYERALELGAKVKVGMRVVDVEILEKGARVVVEKGRREEREEEEEGDLTADLVVGADGIFSKLREVMLEREDEPHLTGDLAYRLLLSTKDMLADEELADFVKNPQVNYWMGPDMHAVNYVLRGGELFNMVLLVPDDMPAGATTLEGNVEEMRALFKDWDPSAGMSLEDAAVLGELLSQYPKSSSTLSATSNLKSSFLQHTLPIYQALRAPRTQIVVERGNTQQYLYHLSDGPEQIERDRKMREQEDGEALAWRDKGFAPWLLGYRVSDEVEKLWIPFREQAEDETKMEIEANNDRESRDARL
ncbi:hypothetical protein ACHAPF_002032 [Botrytis cinerea]